MTEPISFVVNSFSNPLPEATAPRTWQVGALCRAIADSLAARFNPVRVSGEIVNFTLASSGHCYFTLKDAGGQLRCAMFKRSAAGLNFEPRDGELVELQGKVGVYEPRGELQLIVDSMTRAGQGNWFERFLRLKAQLENEGLFDPSRKRPLPSFMRGVAIVTSSNAAALHDVASALQRRAPYLPAILIPAAVQGEEAPEELMAALQKAYRLCETPPPGFEAIDAIVLVRGGGSVEDLWAFNDEKLARLIAQSPAPVVCGVGHETDFTIADFVADLRAPTPTAAAEMVSPEQAAWFALLDHWQTRLLNAGDRWMGRQQQTLDRQSAQLGRPYERAKQMSMRLANNQHRLTHVVAARMASNAREWELIKLQFERALAQVCEKNLAHLAQQTLRLEALNPQSILKRGYALLTNSAGAPLGNANQVQAGDTVHAVLGHGKLDLVVSRIAISGN